MRDSRLGELGHAKGHGAGIAEADAPLLLAGVVVLADRLHAPLGVEQQPTVAGGIGRLEAERGDLGAARRAPRRAGAAWPPPRAACRRTARSRRPGAAPAPAARREAASPVPACVACSNTSMPGATLAASARTASMPGATTRASLSAPAARAVASAWASIERPAMACSTFGTLERMRTPLPAARTTIRRGWVVMSDVQATVRVAAAHLRPRTTQLACRQWLQQTQVLGARCARQRDPRSDAPIAQPLRRRQRSPGRRRRRRSQRGSHPSSRATCAYTSSDGFIRPS